MTPPSQSPSPSEVTRSFDARARGMPRGEDRDGVRGPRHGPDEAHTIAMPTQQRLPEATWPSQRLTRVLVILSVLATGLYVGWWFAPGHVGNPIVFALLAIAEIYTVSHLTGLWQASWSQSVSLPPPGEASFTVDVYVPTYGEPLPELRRTVQAAIEMDGPHRTYVLDDAVRPEVRRLAAELGAYYIPRHDSTGAKAGNMNHALERTDGDLIVVFDADHVARRDFLTHLVAYFDDPKVAIVQTPQYYGNAGRNDVARRAWLQQIPFYGAILRGKQGLGAVFMCGTNAIVRREAIEEVGGFHEESVVEDLATSLELQQAGWRTVYFPYVLAEGQGPGTLRAYLSQQFRWAVGSFGQFGRVFARGFDLVQRMQYLMATTYYLVGFAIAIYLALPVLQLLFGLQPFDVSASLTFPLFLLPHLLLGFWLIRRTLHGNFSFRNVQATFGAFPAYIAAAIAAITGREVDFTPTASQEERRPPWLAWVTVAAAGILLLSLLVSPFLWGGEAWSWVSAIWAALDLYLLAPTAWTTLQETFGDETAEAQPDLDPATGAYSTAPTYELGRYRHPPLPEDLTV